MKNVQIQAVSLPHIHVLVLDDNAGSRVRIHHALRVMGVMHVTEVVSTGAVKSTPSLRTVDLVISDLALGVGSGLALLKGVRLGRVPGIRADTPFIFVADFATPRMISAAAHLDVSGFVIRPLSTERLRGVMLRALKHRAPPAPGKYLNVDVVGAMQLARAEAAGDHAPAPSASSPHARARL